MAANPQYDDPHGIPMTEEAFERLIQERFSADQVIMLDQLNLELPLPLIYEGVFE